MTAPSPSADNPHQHTLILAQDPFREQGGLPASAVYCSTQSAQQLAQLRHFLDKTQYVLLISGPSGSGKTVVARRLLSELDSSYPSLHLDASNGLGAVELLRQVAERYADKRRKAAHITDLFKSLLKSGKTPLLLIDSAELLDRRTLELCLQLARDGMRLVLAADSELESRLTAIRTALWAKSSDIPELQVQRIKPFDLQQTSCYLRHQFLIAGYGGPMPFADAELNEIHQQAGGYPGNINQIARERLLEAPKRPVSHASDMPKSGGVSRSTVIFSVLITLVASVALIVSLRDQVNLAEPADTTTSDSAQAAASVQAGVETSTDVFLPKTQTLVPARAEPVEFTPETKPLLQVDQSAPIASPADTALGTSPLSGPDPLLSLRTVVQDVTDIDSRQAAAASPAPELAEPDTPPVSSPAVEPEKTAKQPEIRTGEYLLGLDPKHYTMQIIAGRKLKSILDFIEDNNIKADSSWYEIQRKGRPWYSLTYGEYDSRKAALDALDSIPKALRSRKPWIRRLSAIQRSIRESGPASQ